MYRLIVPPSFLKSVKKTRIFYLEPMVFPDYILYQISARSDEFFTKSAVINIHASI